MSEILYRKVEPQAPHRTIALYVIHDDWANWHPYMVVVLMKGEDSQMHTTLQYERAVKAAEAFAKYDSGRSGWTAVIPCGGNEGMHRLVTYGNEFEVCLGDSMRHGLRTRIICIDPDDEVAIAMARTVASSFGQAPYVSPTNADTEGADLMFS